jgi:hypothetical protein
LPKGLCYELVEMACPELAKVDDGHHYVEDFWLIGIVCVVAGASAHLRKPPFRPPELGPARFVPPELAYVHKTVPLPPTGILVELGPPRCDGTRQLRGSDHLWKKELAEAYGIQGPELRA